MKNRQNDRKWIYLLISFIIILSIVNDQFRQANHRNEQLNIFIKNFTVLELNKRLTDFQPPKLPPKWLSIDHYCWKNILKMKKKSFLPTNFSDNLFENKKEAELSRFNYVMFSIDNESTSINQIPDMLVEPLHLPHLVCDEKKCRTQNLHSESIEYILVVINAARKAEKPEYRQRVQAIRETFGKVERYKNYEIRFLFVVGYGKYGTDNSGKMKVKEKVEKHKIFQNYLRKHSFDLNYLTMSMKDVEDTITFNDYLIVNYPDSYQNLTTKQFGWMKWISERFIYKELKWIRENENFGTINLNKFDLKSLKIIKNSLNNRLLTNNRVYIEPNFVIRADDDMYLNIFKIVENHIISRNLNFPYQSILKEYDIPEKPSMVNYDYQSSFNYEKYKDILLSHLPSAFVDTIPDKYEQLFCFPGNSLMAANVFRSYKFRTPCTQNPYTHYPNYCSSNGYLVKLDYFRQLTSIAPYMQYLWIEDAFINGLIRSRLHWSFQRLSNLAVIEFINHCNKYLNQNKMLKAATHFCLNLMYLHYSNFVSDAGFEEGIYTCNDGTIINVHVGQNFPTIIDKVVKTLTIIVRLNEAVMSGVVDIHLNKGDILRAECVMPLKDQIAGKSIVVYLNEKKISKNLEYLLLKRMTTKHEVRVIVAYSQTPIKYVVIYCKQEFRHPRPIRPKTPKITRMASVNPYLIRYQIVSEAVIGTISSVIILTLIASMTLVFITSSKANQFPNYNFEHGTGIDNFVIYKHNLPNYYLAVMDGL
ncbi:hypothetical protein SNEBB_002765 [Seison nebaliae]|nr:hypothetical protein SNEBB_002765 [Seison nebaliae]